MILHDSNSSSSVPAQRFAPQKPDAMLHNSSLLSKIQQILVLRLASLFISIKNMVFFFENKI
jgi:hypothetical protein